MASPEPFDTISNFIYGLPDEEALATIHRLQAHLDDLSREYLRPTRLEPTPGWTFPHTRA